MVFTKVLIAAFMSRLLLLIALGVFASSVHALAVQPSSAKPSCKEFTSNGRLTAGTNWNTAIQDGLELRLSFVNGGWWIDIGPPADRTQNFAWPVNPPFRSPEQLVIGPAYYTRAKESASKTPRVLRFVVNENDFHRAVAMTGEDMDFRVRERRIEELGRGVVTFHITDFQLESGLDGKPSDGLAWIVFAGAACVPTG